MEETIQIAGQGLFPLFDKDWRDTGKRVRLSAVNEQGEVTVFSKDSLTLCFWRI